MLILSNVCLWSDTFYQSYVHPNCKALTSSQFFRYFHHVGCMFYMSFPAVSDSTLITTKFYWAVNSSSTLLSCRLRLFTKLITFILTRNNKMCINQNIFTFIYLFYNLSIVIDEIFYDCTNVNFEVTFNNIRI